MLKNLNNIKLIAFDLDGTLLNDNEQISIKTKKKLNELKIPKAIVSSRVLKNIELVIKDIDVDYIIYSSGAVIKDKNKIVEENYIYYEDYLKLIDLIFLKESNASVKIKGDKNIFITNENKYKKISKIEKITIKLFDGLIDIVKNLKMFNYTIVNDKYLIITSKKSSKYLSLKGLLKRLNIKDFEIIYFGDDLNDLEVFKRLPITIAPSNAHKEILKNSTFICESNNNDGVAKFLEQIGKEHKDKNLKKFNGGSVCSVKLDKSKRIIKKEVEINNEGINNGYTKLFYEAKHMQQYNKNNTEIYPNILEIKKQNNKLVVKMDYLYEGTTFTDLLFNNQIGSKFITKSINYIVDSLFKNFYMNKKNIIPNSNYLNTNYFDRLSSRIECVLKMIRKNKSYSILKSILSDGLYINDKYYPSIIEYNNYLRKDELALNKLKIDFCTESHQDLIPSNIIVDISDFDEKINNYKLIDPRGEGDTGVNNRHFTYDIGKLLFGYSGFELLRGVSKKKNYILEQNKNNNIYSFKFNIDSNVCTEKFENARTAVLKLLETNKYNYFDSIDLVNTYKEKILLAEAYCYFADLPCRMINGDSEEILLCFYIKGMQCLSEFMNLIYGKDVIAEND